MKFGPENKLDKKNSATSKNFDDDVTSANCDILIIFGIYGHFEAIR